MREVVYRGEWTPRRRRTDWPHDFVALAESANDVELDEALCEDDGDDDRAPS